VRAVRAGRGGPAQLSACDPACGDPERRRRRPGGHPEPPQWTVEFRHGPNARPDSVLFRHTAVVIPRETNGTTLLRREYAPERRSTTAREARPVATGPEVQGLPEDFTCIAYPQAYFLPSESETNVKSYSCALLNDQLWELLEPLLPPWPDEGARSAAGAGSAVPQGILYVLHTGIDREDLPQELGFRSGMTCWRRIKRWINAGVFDDLHRILLAQLKAANEIDCSRAVIDDSHIDTKKGVPDLDFVPISSPHVSGVRTTREASMRPASSSRCSTASCGRPHTPGPRPDQEPAVRGRLRYTETRRQTPSGTTADQHVDDRREQRLIRLYLLGGPAPAIRRVEAPGGAGCGFHQAAVRGLRRLAAWLPTATRPPIGKREQVAAQSNAGEVVCGLYCTYDDELEHDEPDMGRNRLRQDPSPRSGPGSEGETLLSRRVANDEPELPKLIGDVLEPVRVISTAVDGPRPANSRDSAPRSKNSGQGFAGVVHGAQQRVAAEAAPVGRRCLLLLGAGGDQGAMPVQPRGVEGPYNRPPGTQREPAPEPA